METDLPFGSYRQTQYYWTWVNSLAKFCLQFSIHGWSQLSLPPFVCTQSCPPSPTCETLGESLVSRNWIFFLPLIHSRLFPAIDHKMCMYYLQKLIWTNVMSFVHFWWVLEGRGCVHCGETKICWYLGRDEIKHAVSLMVALIHRFWQTFWLGGWSQSMLVGIFS